MTSPFSAPPGQEGKVRALIAAIVLMTLAMAFLLGMIVTRLMTPSSAAPPARIDVASAAEMEIVLPAGARVVRESVGEGRVIVAYEGPDGGRGAIAAPAPAGTVHIVYRIADGPG